MWVLKVHWKLLIVADSKFRQLVLFCRALTLLVDVYLVLYLERERTGHTLNKLVCFFVSFPAMLVGVINFASKHSQVSWYGGGCPRWSNGH
jgi:hypothetical protein